MFSRWCDFCNHEQKCKNVDDKLYCIECGTHLDTVHSVQAA